MNYGMQISAAGALTSMHRMDVLSHNLANVSTSAFKSEVSATMARDAARIEDGLYAMPSNTLLERLGAGTLLAPNRIAFEQGALVESREPLDFAIEGEGYFVVRDQTDVTGDRLRYTRDGRFRTDPNGRLVTASSGQAVVGADEREIVLRGSEPISVDARGVIRQNGDIVGRLALSEFPSRDALIRKGNAMFAASAASTSSKRPAHGEIRQGYVEASNVDPVKTMVDLTEAARDVEFNLNLIQTQDRLNERAISGLGRVA